MKPATLKHLHSSGGVIYRRSGETIEVALIATKKGALWTLPKGLIDRGENPADTAVREIVEETGLVGAVVASLGERSYWFYLKNDNVKCRKTVSYFLLEYVGGDIAKYGWEVDEARWFPIDEAIRTVFYRSDKEILERAREHLTANQKSPVPE